MKYRWCFKARRKITKGENEKNLTFLSKEENKI